MKTLLMLAGVFALGAVAPAVAANANHPYQNCDKRVDDCGPTGDQTTDQLNAQQLGGQPGMPPGQPGMQGQPMPGQPMPGQPMPGQMPMRNGMAPRQ